MQETVTDSLQYQFQEIFLGTVAIADEPAAVTGLLANLAECGLHVTLDGKQLNGRLNDLFFRFGFPFFLGSALYYLGHSVIVTHPPVRIDTAALSNE